MELAGKTKLAAIDHLDRFGFSGSECYEITGQFVIGDTDRISAPWTNIAEAIKSTLRCSIRTGSRHDMTIGGLPQAYSYHNDQAISGDDRNRHHREKNLSFKKATDDWADCKKVIRCIFPGQLPRGPVDINNTYFHFTPEGR
jgi:hypothetical protein